MYNFTVNSSIKNYDVVFNDNIETASLTSLGTHFVIDKNVSHFFDLTQIQNKTVLIDANEQTKDYFSIGNILKQLLDLQLKKDSRIVAVGGGITQDVVCFIATNFMRGINWVFIPTTLLAQADSCIGSKSSINFESYKNILGSFYPPDKIIISNKFLLTLSRQDFLSGLGEIVKLFIIANKNIDTKKINLTNIKQYVYDALMIKKEFIEKDEFDKNIRNILNYGHCIGHGIESATNFEIPHGIAVAMGMDVINKFAHQNNFISEDQFKTLHSNLYPLYQNFIRVKINLDSVFEAQKKDKKNLKNKINLIIPVNERVEKKGFENEKAFWNNLKNAFSDMPLTIT